MNSQKSPRVYNDCENIANVDANLQVANRITESRNMQTENMMRFIKAMQMYTDHEAHSMHSIHMRVYMIWSKANNPVHDWAQGDQDNMEELIKVHGLPHTQQQNKQKYMITK